MTGFSIAEVRIKGNNMPDAVVTLGRGLSLFTGPSDTGKSLIADAINHVFGAHAPLRDVPERAQYDLVQVQVIVYETAQVFTLERAWGGGAVRLYSVADDTIDILTPNRVLKEVHDASDDSVSGFLLGLAGLQGRLIRTNADGAKHSLSFRNLPNYVLVQEDRIITKTSPILSGQNTEGTKEESLFRCLLTGVDDSAIITNPDTKVRRGLDAGRTEVLETLIADAESRVAATGLTEDRLREELQTVEAEIANQAPYRQSISSELDQHQQRLKDMWSSRRKHGARHEQISELRERFTLLNIHYEADIARLESTQESGRLLVQLTEGPCPLCGADPTNHRHEGLLKSEDVATLTDACIAEQSKLQRLKADLQKTLERLNQEQQNLITSVQALDEAIRSIQAIIANDLEPTARLTEERFGELLRRRSEAERAASAYDELRRLQSARTTFDTKTKQEATKQAFETTPPRITEELATIIQDILAAWNYPELDRVVFDSTTKDIVINGKPRGSHGKGYRALTYTAFMLGVMLYCRRKDLPHPGFIVLDSPLVTYRKPDQAAEDLINEGMVPPFYNYLAGLSDDYQVVIIENDAPPENIKESSTYTHFTRNDALGRYGFLLPTSAQESDVIGRP